MAFCSCAILVNAQIDDGEFILIDSNSDTAITTIFDGAIYDLNVVGDSLNIRAIPSQSYTHVRFTSSDGFIQTEGVAPYAYKGDVSGNYNAWSPSVGVLVFTIDYLNSGTVVTTDTFTISFTNGYSSGGSSLWTATGSDINYTAGNVAIGTNAIPSGYKLAVNGNIIAEELKVQLQSQWPDYVFVGGYHLPSLEQVEQHIEENGHLVNIPSAKEVESNGIEVGEMNRLLLEKIEELTLYTIDQEKQLQQLTREIKELKSNMSTTRADSKHSCSTN